MIQYTVRKKRTATKNTTSITFFFFILRLLSSVGVLGFVSVAYLNSIDKT